MMCSSNRWWDLVNREKWHIRVYFFTSRQETHWFQVGVQDEVQARWLGELLEGKISYEGL